MSMALLTAQVCCAAVAAGWSAETEETGDIVNKEETTRFAVPQQRQPALLLRRVEQMRADRW